MPDEELIALLDERRSTPRGHQRGVERRIYRRRRYLKRKRWTEALTKAASANRAPDQKKTASCVPWSKLAGSADPETFVRQHFQKIYSLSLTERTEEESARQRYINVWKSLRIDLSCFRLSLAALSAILKKLKRGKGSPDGITAEMYQALPEVALVHLNDFLFRVLHSLDIPLEWCQTFAVLLQKTVGACSLAKYRPIASLPAIRKLFGYVFLRMLPPLKFVSLQTGFAPGSQAASGLFCIKRAA